MTRLVLALVIVMALIAGLVVLVLGVRSAVNEAAPQGDANSQMQKIAYALLVALILYVAFLGGTA